MGIEIREVLTPKDLWRWVRFPNALYRNNENFVPFLENDEFEIGNKPVILNEESSKEFAKYFPAIMGKLR